MQKRRFLARAVNLAGMSALLLALPSLARIPGPWGMSACLACIGVCQAALVPAQGQLKSNWLPDGPERVFAQRIIGLGMRVGYPAAAAAVPWVAKTFGWRAVPWTLKSLSANIHPNALKDTYDYSCFLARSTKYQHLMTSTSTPRRHGLPQRLLRQPAGVRGGTGAGGLRRRCQDQGRRDGAGRRGAEGPRGGGGAAAGGGGGAAAGGAGGAPRAGAGGSDWQQQ